MNQQEAVHYSMGQYTDSPGLEECSEVHVVVDSDSLAVVAPLAVDLVLAAEDAGPCADKRHPVNMLRRAIQMKRYVDEQANAVAAAVAEVLVVGRLVGVAKLGLVDTSGGCRLGFRNRRLRALVGCQS